MGSVTMHVIPVKEEDAQALRDALKDHSADMVIDRALESKKRGPMVQNLMERFDKNGNEKLEPDERVELRRVLRTNGWVPGNFNNSF
jgi:hypothetical protein